MVNNSVSSQNLKLLLTGLTTGNKARMIHWEVWRKRKAVFRVFRVKDDTSKMSLWQQREQCDSRGMWGLTDIRGVERTKGSVSPWKRAGSSSGKASGENLYLFLSSKLTSSLQYTKPQVTALTLTHITPSHCASATNTAGTNEAWLDG